MGYNAWDMYKKLVCKEMTASRRPQGRGASDKHVAARNQKLGGYMSGWPLECEPERLTGVDTRWRMDDRLRWLPPNGDVAATHVGTLPQHM